MILFSKINKKQNENDIHNLKQKYDDELKKQKTESEAIIEKLKQENENIRKTVISEIIQNMRSKGFNEDAIKDVLGNKVDLV